VTLIAPGLLPGPPIVETGDQRVMWDVQVTERSPAVVLSTRTRRGLRLVILESDAPSSNRDVLRQLQRWADRAPGEAADRLRDQAGRGTCSSVTILDAGSNGHIQIAVRHAPSALLLRAGHPGAVVLDESIPPQWQLQATAGDLLILCSATCLENPPEILGRVRSPSNQRPDTGPLRRALARSTTAGASVTLFAHRFPGNR
jgi:hypothetical protein